MNGPTGVLIPCWISILAAILHLKSAGRYEYISFYVLEAICLVNGAIEVGMTETGVENKYLRSIRIITTIATINYLVSSAFKR